MAIPEDKILDERVVALIGQVSAINAKLDGLITAFEKSDDDAKESRSRLYSQVEALARQQAEIRVEQTNQATRLSKIEATIEEDVLPVIETIKRMEQRAHGAAWVGRSLRWVARGIVFPVAGALIAFWEELVALFTRAP